MSDKDISSWKKEYEQFQYLEFMQSNFKVQEFSSNKYFFIILLILTNLIIPPLQQLFNITNILGSISLLFHSAQHNNIVMGASGLAIGILTILLIILKKKQNLKLLVYGSITLVIAVLGNIFYSVVNYSSANNKNDFINQGFNQGMLFIFVFMQIPFRKPLLITNLAVFILRWIVIPPQGTGFKVFYVLTHIFLPLLLFAKLKQREQMFKIYHQKNQEMIQFKNYMRKDFDSGMLVISKNNEIILYENETVEKCRSKRQLKAFLDSFNIVEDLAFFQGKSTNQKNSKEKRRSSVIKGSLKLDIIQSYQQRPLSEKIFEFLSKDTIEQKMELTLKRNNTTQNQNPCTSNFNETEDNLTDKTSSLPTDESFQLKVNKIQWDNQEAAVLLFNNLSDQEAVFNLKSASEQKDLIVSSLSHELRTPLNAILGVTQILKQKITKASKEVYQYLEVSENCCKLLMNLVNGFLDLQLMRFDKFELRLSQINIKKLLEDICLLFSYQCQQKKIYIKLEIDKGVPDSLYSDSERITQVLVNLVGNAIKFTFKGGIIIQVQKSLEQAEALEISVVDTGVGIKPEDQDKLFKEFSKLEQSKNINQGGIGLGLMICQRLVHHLGNKSTIQLQSKFGEGSKFSFMVCNQTMEQESIEQQTLINSYNISNCDEDKLLNQLSNFEELISTDSMIVKKLDEGLNGNSHMNDSSNHMTNINTTLNDSTQTNKKKQNSIKQQEQQKKKNILIVDDNVFNIMVIENLLDRDIFQVNSALNGELAIQKTKFMQQSNQPLSLIFMDIQMPVMDGIEATKQLKQLMQRGEIQAIPIVGVSAHCTELDLKESDEINEFKMDDLFSKPVNQKVIHEILEKYVSKQ